MNDYSKFNTINNMKSRDTKKINSKSSLRGSYNKKKSKNDLETEEYLDIFVFLILFIVLLFS